MAGSNEGKELSSTISESRPLTESEASLIRWLLQNGAANAARYSDQIDRVSVCSRCRCGCASIDLALDAKKAPIGEGMEILADYLWDGEGDAPFGVYIYAS